jgi:hypothetical protein
MTTFIPRSLSPPDVLGDDMPITRRAQAQVQHASGPCYFSAIVDRLENMKHAEGTHHRLDQMGNRGKWKRKARLGFMKIPPMHDEEMMVKDVNHNLLRAKELGVHAKCGLPNGRRHHFVATRDANALNNDHIMNLEMISMFNPVGSCLPVQHQMAVPWL